MMKGNFEKKLKNIIDNSSQLVDNEALWTGIERKLDRKKRKFLMIWLPTGFILLIVFGFYFNQTFNSLDSNSTFQNEYDEIQELLLNGNIEIENQLPKGKQVSTLKIDQEISQANNITSQANKYRFSNKDLNKSTQSQTKTINPFIDQKDTQKAHLLSKPIIERNIIADSKLTYSSDLVNLSKTENTNESVTDLPLIDNISESKLFNEIYFLPAFELSSLDLSIRIDYSELRNFDTWINNQAVKPDLDPKGKINPKLFTAFSFGISAYRGQKNILNPNSTLDINIRNSTEDFLDMYSLSTKVALLSWKGFSINSGLTYNYLTDVMEWKGDVFKKIKQEYVESNLLTIEQDVIQNYANGETTVRFEKHVKKYNESHIFDLPIGIGYRFDLRKFSIGIIADMNFSYMLSGEVNYINQDLELITETQDDQWLSPKFTYGAGFDYNWNDHNSLGFQIFYRQLNIEQLGLKQDYRLWGTRLQLKRFF